MVTPSCVTCSNSLLSATLIKEQGRSSIKCTWAKPHPEIAVIQEDGLGQGGEFQKPPPHLTLKFEPDREKISAGLCSWAPAGVEHVAPIRPNL